MLKAFNTCSYRRAGSRSPVLAALIIRYAMISGTADPKFRSDLQARSKASPIAKVAASSNPTSPIGVIVTDSSWWRRHWGDRYSGRWAHKKQDGLKNQISALGQKRTFAVQIGMSALPPKADFGLSGSMSALCSYFARANDLGKFRGMQFAIARRGPILFVKAKIRGWTCAKEYFCNRCHPVALDNKHNGSGPKGMCCRCQGAVW